MTPWGDGAELPRLTFKLKINCGGIYAVWGLWKLMSACAGRHLHVGILLNLHTFPTWGRSPPFLSAGNLINDNRCLPVYKVWFI
jgi:hypothetical protein